MKTDISSIFIKGEKNIIDEIKKITYKDVFISRRNQHVSNEVTIHLNSDFSQIDHIPGLKTTLYQHQKTAVRAMLDLEYKRSYEQSKADKEVIKISYNVGVLSEPVGSGKTIDILSVICLNAIPRPVPDIMELPTINNFYSVGYVRCKFKKLLKPTIIFVGSSVMKQWQNAIKQFTDLTVFCVNSVIELKKLFNMISNRTINDYNIILVKNGKITVPIELPNNIKLEDKNKVSTPYFYNLIANLRYYCWARVVVDDFDTIKLPHNAGIVRGIFTWYISSTRKKMEFRNNKKPNYTLASEWLTHHDYGCANIMYNHYLFNTLNIRNDIEYLKSTTKVPYPKYHACIFENPNNKFISILNSMGDEEVKRITEMLNGDAINEAAQAAGIKTTSVADIFSRILGSKYKSYRYACDLLDFIEYQNDKKDERLPMSENPDPEDKYYTKTDLTEFRDIEYKYPGVNSLLKTCNTEYTDVKNQNGLAIQRVKDNIKHGICPVCRIDLTECKEVIIVKCCNAVFCTKCGINAQQLNDRYSRLQNGNCSNCRARLTIKDLIYIGDEINIEDIEEDNIEDDDEKDEELDPKTLKKSLEKRNKYIALIDIINGEKPIEDVRVDLHIPNMMKGAMNLPEEKTRKVLIFANYEETLKEITKILDEKKIHYWKLQGGINEIAETSFKFTEYKGTCAMVINSSKHCAGLNLQTATDLVFAHRMIDQSIESQVAGRGHRLGRTSPLNIWYMLYDNEYEELKNTHSVRELTKNELIHEKAREDGTETSEIDNIEDNSGMGF